VAFLFLYGWVAGCDFLYHGRGLEEVPMHGLQMWYSNDRILENSVLIAKLRGLRVSCGSIPACSTKVFDWLKATGVM